MAFQVSAATPAHPSPPPVRVVFMGGDWSAGNWTKDEESLPIRFRIYLEKFLGRKVELRMVRVPDPSSLPTLVTALLAERPADYVFFLCDHSGVPVSFASEKMAPWEPSGNSLSYYFSRQIGAIRLATGMRKSALPEDVLLNPFTEIMRKSTAAATASGAKFVLLWPGFPITQMSWTSQVPKEWPAYMASYLDFFKTKPLVSSERLMLHFRRNSIRYVANLQISRYFASLRQNAKDKGVAAIWSPKATDDVAKMLATSVVATEF